MKIAVVDLQGFQVYGEFVPKELGIQIGNEVRYWIFKSPVPYNELDRKSKETTIFLERHLGLPYDIGNTDLSELREIVKTLISCDRVYVRGHGKVVFLQKLLTSRCPTTIDISTLQNAPKSERNYTLCGNHTENGKCVINNCREISNFIFNFLPM